MTMTLEQVLKEMNTVTATSNDAENWQVVDWCSAISVHIAAMGVPEGQVDLQSHVMRTAVAHGGLRQLSRDLSIDVGYLSRLANGEKTEPGEEILAKLGLEKRVVYLSKQAEFMRACEQESQSND